MCTVNKEDLMKAFRELGLKEGDVCLFHSSFKSLGTVEGGAETVIGAFEEVLGKEGTLVAPTLSTYDFYNSYKTWYMDKPSHVGYLTEYFRKQMYVYRSNQETHSVAARGKLAYELTFEHTAYGPHLCPFGEYAFAESSPWVKMDKLNARTVFIGVPMRYNTMKHVIEGRLVEHFLSMVKSAQKRQALISQLRVFGVDGGVWPFYNAVDMQERLDQMGLVSHAKCGNAELISVEAGVANKAALEILINEYEDWFADKPAVCQWISACKE